MEDHRANDGTLQLNVVERKILKQQRPVLDTRNSSYRFGIGDDGFVDGRRGVLHSFH
jgi:hypothetical protein